MSNALDRIDKLDEVKPELTIDEQMAAADELTNPASSDFFNGMSPEAAEAMNRTINKDPLLDNEIKFEETEEQPIVEPIPESPVVEKDEPKEELFNNNTEEKSRRGRKKKEESTESVKSGTYDPIMDQLAKDLLADLKKRKYTIGTFSSEQTKLIIDYIFDKI